MVLIIRRTFKVNATPLQFSTTGHVKATKSSIWASKMHALNTNRIDMITLLALTARLLNSNMA